jgi:hypothetical protein
MGRDPNLPKLPLGGSRNEVFYVLTAIGILALIAFAFWFEATH